jgi:WD40 repeat protein
MVSALIAAAAATAADPPQPPADGTYVCKLDGSDQLRLAAAAAPAWEPDGKSLLLGADTAIYRVAVDGSEKVLVCQDSKLAIIMNLAVSPSGKFAAASVVRRDDHSGSVRVWTAADGKQVLDDEVYKQAIVGDGRRFHPALLAWHPANDLLAWIPIEYAEVAARAKFVKVFDGAAGRWNTWYLDREAASLCWRPDTSDLVVASGDGLLQLGDGGNRRRTLVAKVAGGGAGDSPLTWLPKGGHFFWGAGFWDQDGQTALPALPDTDGPPAKLCWAAPDGRGVVLAMAAIDDKGQCSCDLLEGSVGRGLTAFRKLCRLPTTPQQVYLSNDGARVAYTVGGYVPE